MSSDRADEQAFNQQVADYAKTMEPDFTKKLSILVVGRVSTGKSSLINALFERDRQHPIFAVRAEAGVTRYTEWVDLSEAVAVGDSPGLDDPNDTNSAKTRQMLGSGAVDVGILVVSGAADKGQVDTLKQLAACKRTFVVLNKIDEWSGNRKGLERVLKQWHEALGRDDIFPTCVKGFDPDSDADAPMDVRGIDNLRNAVLEFAAAEGSDLVLARVMQSKTEAVTKVIAAAVVAVSLEAFLLVGSGVFITGTQAIALVRIYYLHTGRTMTVAQALGLIPVFLASAIGSTLFLFVKSFLPPTGILDAAAAVTAAIVTLAMLVAVHRVLAAGESLDQRDKLSRAFTDLRGQVKLDVAKASGAELRSKEFWASLVRSLMYVGRG